MPKQKMTRAHLTSDMRNWTDLEIRAVYYLLEQPHLIKTKHRVAIQRAGTKLRIENRARSSVVMNKGS